MFLKSVIRDCLHLNWAFPRQALPEPPAGLRYEMASDGCQDRVFGSALLFRRERPPVGVPRAGKLLSYPQFHFRLYVLDDEDVPAVWLRRVLVPAWVAPGASLVSGVRLGTARFRYPAPFDPAAEGWSWEVRRREGLLIEARRGFPTIHECKDLGSFDQIAQRLRERERGYMLVGTNLRRLELSSETQSRLPLAVDLLEADLLHQCLPLEASTWPALHSAWLCPEMPLSFSFGTLDTAGMRGKAALT